MFYKITNQDETEYNYPYNYQYKDGLNEAINKNDKNSYIFFADSSTIMKLINFDHLYGDNGYFLREVYLPQDDLKEKDLNRGGWISKKIILGTKYKLWEAKTFELLKKNGVNISMEGGYENILRSACSNGDYEIVKFFIDNNVDINFNKYENIYRDSPLCGACENGHLEIVKLLVSNGANINKDNYMSPLCLACYNGHFEIVKFLVEKGSNINQPISSLCHAIINGHSEIVKFLIENGSDINPDNIDINPLRKAILCDHYDIVVFLIERGADIHKYEILSAATKNGYLKIIKLLWEKGIDFVSYPKALYYAVKYGHYKVVKFLVENGMDIKIYYKNINLETLAYRNDHLKIFKFVRNLRDL